MKHFLILFAALVFSLPVYAERATHEDIVITVNGMVCDFCAQSVMKVFNDFEAVNDIDINMDTGEVTVHLKPGMSLSDDDVEKSIIYAGYDLVGFERVTGTHE